MAEATEVSQHYGVSTCERIFLNLLAVSFRFRKATATREVFTIATWEIRSIFCKLEIATEACGWCSENRRRYVATEYFRFSDFTA